MSIKLLPVEILFYIFELVHSKNPLSECLLVCRTWSGVAQKIFWRDIRLNSYHDVEKALPLLKRKNVYFGYLNAHLVKSLTIPTFENPEDVKLIKICKNLKNLDILGGIDINLWKENLQNVSSSLHRLALKWRDISDLVTMLPSTVTKLRLQLPSDMPWSEDVPTELFAGQLKHLKITGINQWHGINVRDVSSITKMSLEGNVVEDMFLEITDNNNNNWSSLKRLSLRNYGSPIFDLKVCSVMIEKMPNLEMVELYNSMLTNRELLMLIDGLKMVRSIRLMFCKWIGDFKRDDVIKSTAHNQNATIQFINCKRVTENDLIIFDASHLGVNDSSTKGTS
jgi:hypothetical protein